MHREPSEWNERQAADPGAESALGGQSAAGSGGEAHRRGRRSPAAPVVQHAYDLYLWLIPFIDRLPRVRRFTLGQRIESSALEVLEALTEAAYCRDRAAALARASRTLQRLRFLVRAAKDLRLVDLRRYEFASERIDEIGRMVGGWMRSQKEPNR
jgi:hypothetical protein